MVKINMKSFVSGIIVGSVLFSGVSFAAPSVVKLIVNGKELHPEVPAQIIDGSTLVPARALAEALGASVTWDAKNQAVIVEKAPSLTAFGEAEVRQLTSAAKEHYWTISIGGKGEHSNEEVTVPGKDYNYRWMGSDLDTKAKLIAYLEEVYTPEQAAAFWTKESQDGSLVDIGGKLAQPNADGGNLLDWSKAKVRVVDDGDKQKTFQLTVPLGEFEVGSEEKQVKVRWLDGKGWRIDVPVSTIR